MIVVDVVVVVGEDVVAVALLVGNAVAKPKVLTASRSAACIRRCNLENVMRRRGAGNRLVDVSVEFHRSTAVAVAGVCGAGGG